MLQNLHVKNLALIDEIEVEFGDGLNIRSGQVHYTWFCESGAWGTLYEGYLEAGCGIRIRGADLPGGE